MLVKDWMSKNVITTHEGEAIHIADTMMTSNQIHSLPVVKKNRLVGIVTSGDINRVMIRVLKSSISTEDDRLNRMFKVSDVMSKPVYTVKISDTISETIELFQKHRILGTPVVNEAEELVGIITKTDIFNTLISMTTADKEGIDFGLLVEDRSGSIKEITDIIRSYSGRIASILASSEQARIGYRNVHVRAYDIGKDQLFQIKQKLIKTTTLRYILNASEQRREFF